MWSSARCKKWRSHASYLETEFQTFLNIDGCGQAHSSKVTHWVRFCLLQGISGN